MNTAYEEKLLLLNIADGDAEAFRQLYDLHHKQVFSFAFHFTKTVEDAEEITQDIFIRIWKYRGQLPSVDNFEGWLKTVVKNRCLTWLHKTALRKNAAKKLFQLQMQEFVYNSVLDRELEKAMGHAINRLPDQQKAVFLLSRKNGMKHKDIAQTLGVTISTVKNHMKAALQSIRIYLHNHTDTKIIAGILLQFIFF
jgi:RNA polymerase sigma-70 factor (ECF subfamily)